MGAGKGQTQPQRSHPLPHGKQSPGSYLKTSSDPTGGVSWSCGGKRRAASGESVPKPLAAWAAYHGGKRCTPSGESAPKPLAARAAHRGGKRRTTPGRGHPSLWLLEPLRPVKSQNAGATESALLWSAQNLDLHST